MRFAVSARALCAPDGCFSIDANSTRIISSTYCLAAFSNADACVSSDSNELSVVLLSSSKEQREVKCSNPLRVDRNEHSINLC